MEAWEIAFTPFWDRSVGTPSQQLSETSSPNTGQVPPSSRVRSASGVQKYNRTFVG